jgi:hypothetical protein
VWRLLLLKPGQTVRAEGHRGGKPRSWAGLSWRKGPECQLAGSRLGLEPTSGSDGARLVLNRMGHRMVNPVQPRLSAVGHACAVLMSPSAAPSSAGVGWQSSRPWPGDRHLRDLALRSALRCQGAKTHRKRDTLIALHPALFWPCPGRCGPGDLQDLCIRCRQTADCLAPCEHEVHREPDSLQFRNYLLARLPQPSAAW